MNDIEKAIKAMRENADARSLRKTEKVDLDRRKGEPKSVADGKKMPDMTRFQRQIDKAGMPRSETSRKAGHEEEHAKARQPAPTNDSQNICNLPIAHLEKKGFITFKTQKNKLTEEYRRIKRPLLKNLHSDEIESGCPNVIAVTSALSGEGKTYSAVNLAMSMAIEKERTVLLVDADVLKGSIGRLFSIKPNQIGLTDVLNDASVSLSDVIVQTNVPSLRFIPAGKTKAHANELLSSDAMSELIFELAERYRDRVIILDCPPILQTNEANILVDHAGQVVFVVAEEDTGQKLVVKALEQIDEKKYVGILVNKSSRRIGNYDYYDTPYV